MSTIVVKKEKKKEKQMYESLETYVIRSSDTRLNSATLRKY